jgi:hypothetical protein
MANYMEIRVFFSLNINYHKLSINLPQIHNHNETNQTISCAFRSGATWGV